MYNGARVGVLLELVLNIKGESIGIYGGFFRLLLYGALWAL